MAPGSDLAFALLTTSSVQDVLGYTLAIDCLIDWLFVYLLLSFYHCIKSFTGCLAWFAWGLGGGGFRFYFASFFLFFFFSLHWR